MTDKTTAHSLKDSGEGHRPMTEGKKGVSPGLEQTSVDVTSLNPDPWSNILHVYGQYYCHCDAEIRGTPEALRALAEAINVALTKGRAEMLTMASDGEGYRLQVQRTNGTGMNAGGTRHYVMRMYDRGRAEAADEWKAEYARLIGAIRKLKANRTRDTGAGRDRAADCLKAARAMFKLEWAGQKPPPNEWRDGKWYWTGLAGVALEAIFGPHKNPDEGAPPLSPETAGEGSHGIPPNLNRQGD